jgi:hypothetical protein
MVAAGGVVDALVEVTIEVSPVTTIPVSWAFSDFAVHAMTVTTAQPANVLEMLKPIMGLSGLCVGAIGARFGRHPDMLLF